MGWKDRWTDGWEFGDSFMVIVIVSGFLTLSSFFASLNSSSHLRQGIVVVCELYNMNIFSYTYLYKWSACFVFFLPISQNIASRKRRYPQPFHFTSINRSLLLIFNCCSFCLSGSLCSGVFTVWGSKRYKLVSVRAGTPIAWGGGSYGRVGPVRADQPPFFPIAR